MTTKQALSEQVEALEDIKNTQEERIKLLEQKNAKLEKAAGKKPDHSWCAFLVMALAGSLVITWTIGRDEWIEDGREAVAQEEYDTALADSLFPGYVKDDCDWQFAPMEPVMIGNREIEFGLAKDGTVVWRQHAEVVDGKRQTYYHNGYEDWGLMRRAAKLDADREATFNHIKDNSIESRLKALESKETSESGAFPVTTNSVAQWVHEGPNSGIFYIEMGGERVYPWIAMDNKFVQGQ